jgi:hypothetical protein
LSAPRGRLAVVVLAFGELRQANLRLSLSGKVLEKFGSIPIHNAANFWEYDTAAVAANGDGWTTRAVPGKLYRFHA